MDNSPEKPWVVYVLRDRGPGHHYRFRVEGINLWDLDQNNHPRVFIWDIPAPPVCGQWSNYDFSAVGGDPCCIA